MFGIDAAKVLFNAFMPIEPLFAGIFIIICGISSQLSHSNIKRGLILLIISILLSVVTILFVPGGQIYFGILHFLSLCIILFSFLQKYIEKIPAPVAIIFCIVLYFLTYSIREQALGINGVLSFPLPESLYQNNYFFIFGFINSSFYSADYFPLLPWIFAFLFGTVLGRYARDGKFPQFMYIRRFKPLSFIGNHALIIYIVHQPVIYGILFLLNLIFKFN